MHGSSSYFRSLPLWLKALFSFAGILLSTFAGRLPEHWQEAGLYAGIFCVCFGALAFIVHIAAPYIGMISLSQFFFGHLEQTNPSGSTPIEDDGQKSATLLNCYQFDFTKFLTAKSDISILFPDRAPSIVSAKVIFDFQSNAKYLAVFIPHDTDTKRICMRLSEIVDEVIPKIEGGTIVSARSPTDLVTTSNQEMRFTGQVYIYHERQLSLRDTADIIDAFKAVGLNLHLRGLDYFARKMAMRA